MKKIYVAHPYQGKRSNMQAITHICQRLVKFGVMPISSVHSFSFLHDHIPGERKQALEFCEELVSTADEVWFFGDWQNSQGCQREWSMVKRIFKQVRFVDGWNERGYPIFRGETPEWLKL